MVLMPRLFWTNWVCHLRRVFYLMFSCQVLSLFSFGVFSLVVLCVIAVGMCFHARV